MINLLQTEWLKIKAYKPFWLVFLLYPVCLGGITAVALWSQSKLQDMATVAGAGAAVSSKLPFAFPTAWQSVAYLASFLHFIPALLLILNLTNEFQFRTHRQNLLEGWSRAQFLVAKLSLAFGLSLYCTVNTLLFALLAGLWSGTAPGPQGSGYLALFLLQSLVYNTFALLLAFLVRRAALSLAAFLLYSTILESLLGFFVTRSVEGLGAYLPLKAANGLLPVPLLKENAPQAAKELLEGPAAGSLLIASVLYLGLFLGFMWWRYRSEDL